MTAAVASFAVSLFAAVAFGRPILRWLQASGVRQTISSDAPERHAAKQGTPTMGGLILLAGTVCGTVVGWTAWGVSSGGALAACAIGLSAAIGALDDRLSLRRGTNLGLKAREKFALQVVVALAFVAGVALIGARRDQTIVAGLDLGPAYWPLAVVLIVGLSNATNLADGLDGLTAGSAAIASAGLAVMLSSGSGKDVTVLAAALAGGCAGLLWYGAYPALVFMGDTGSLAVGAGLACIGLVGKLELPLIVATLPFWAETLSVMIQVTVFKWRKRRHGIEFARAHRVFRRAPLHHHLEECGVPETRIVARFWLCAAACTALGLAWHLGLAR